MKTERYLSTGQHWDTERAYYYNNLEWVKAQGPLDKIVELAKLAGSEVVVDAGTGTQSVLNHLSSTFNDIDGSGTVIGFDVSPTMLANREGNLPQNVRLLLADFCRMPFPNNSIDLLVTRQVLHNLPEVEEAILESQRVLRDGGKFIGVEYVAVDDNVLAFEQVVFDIKEPGRNLWTGEQFREVVYQAWNIKPMHNSLKRDVALHYFNLEHYSVGNWMKNSGLPEEKQQQIIQLYHNAPENIAKKMNIVSEDGDIFTDRLFAYIVAAK